MESFVLWHRTAPAAHDEDADLGADLAWMRHVAAQLTGAGAHLLGPIGSTCAGVFHADELGRAVELALALLEEAEKSPAFATAPRIAFGAGLGELDYLPAVDGMRVEFIGAAIDRAQVLANRARAGELVLDARARDAASNTFLFHRTVGTGEASLRGHSVDREEPRLADCRRNFVHVGRPPTPAIIAEAFAPMRDDATSDGAHTVIVRGPVGNGARRSIAELEFVARPSLVLRCLGVPGGLEPLGSLRTGLVRAFGPGANRLSRLEALDAGSYDALVHIACGEVIDIDAALHAVYALLRASSRSDTSKPWIVIDPAHEADESTLEIAGRLARIAELDLFTIVQVRPGTRVPTALLRSHRLREIEVPRLRPEDVRSMVEKMLREPTGGEIARRVAMTSASTPQAVVECVRAFIASGDVVRRGRTFVFRVGPRITGERSTYIDWVAERIALLDDDSARLLELLALAPVGATHAELEELAAADGFDAPTLEASLSRLRDDRLVLASPSVEIDTTELRDWLVARMPGPRRAELAAAIAARLATQPGFARATHGHYLAESGASGPAADALLDAAERAVATGHSRAGIRLAAAAVSAAPAADVRARAAGILRGATLREAGSVEFGEGAERTTIEIPAPDVESPASVVVQAARLRDFERVDRYVDLAIAEGAPLAAADRWRAIVAAMRGETTLAAQSIARARERSGSDPSTVARNELLAALLELRDGRAETALRGLLTTLADLRERGDRIGERATLRALAVCFTELGQADAATRLATG